MSFNKVIFMGNLTRDPETRQAGSSSVCSFGMASSRKYKTRDGDGNETEAAPCDRQAVLRDPSRPPASPEEITDEWRRRWKAADSGSDLDRFKRRFYGDLGRQYVNKTTHLHHC